MEERRVTGLGTHPKARPPPVSLESLNTRSCTRNEQMLRIFHHAHGEERWVIAEIDERNGIALGVEDVPRPHETKSPRCLEMRGGGGVRGQNGPERIARYWERKLPYLQRHHTGYIAPLTHR